MSNNMQKKTDKQYTDFYRHFFCDEISFLNLNHPSYSFKTFLSKLLAWLIEINYYEYHAFFMEGPVNNILGM